MSDALPAVPPLPQVLIGASSKAYLGLAELTRWVQVVTAVLGELGGGEGAAAPRAVPYLCMPAALLGPLGSTLTAAGMLVGAQDVSRFDPRAHTGAIRESLQARGRHNARIVYGGSAVVGTFTGIVEAANDAAQRPDGIFLGRGGLAPENFLATIEEVRAVTRPSARTSSAN